jgi:preprotein translocase subunit YajC
LLLIFAGYWALVVFPKQRAFKKHQRHIQSLHVGDEVVTYGGLIGTITWLNDASGTARIRLAEGVEVRILAAALVQHFDAEEIARNVRLAHGVEDSAAESTPESRESSA